MEKNLKSIIFQRKHPRVNLNLKGDFQITSGDGDSKPIPILVKILGCGGFMFESSIPLVKGTRLDMNIFYKNKTIPFTGEIIWADSPIIHKNSGFKCGAHFLKISHENLLNVHFILYTHLFRPKNKLKKTARMKKNVQ